MTISDLLNLRLHNQLITNPISYSPEEVITWFGALQAQDFSAAKWAIGIRANAITDKQVEDAFNQGKILRTHILRPTWHFVTPNDIQWLLRLTKEQVHKRNHYYYLRLGLDTAVLEKCISVIRNALQGNMYLTREELGNKIVKMHNFTKEIKLTIGYILMYAELEGIICSGPRRGKQFTYALLEERVPKETSLDHEASLAELTLRYFQSHGPATLQDFTWWSGLTTSDAKKGIALVKSKLNQENIERNVYWFINLDPTKKEELDMYLLPNYDEYIVAYKNRSFIFDSKHTTTLDSRANPLFQHTIIFDGKVIGTWKRDFKGTSVSLSTNIFEKLGKSEEKLLEHALDHFGKYVNRPISYGKI